MKTKFYILINGCKKEEREGNKHILKISTGEEIEVATSIEEDGWSVTDIESGLRFSGANDLLEISVLEYIYGDGSVVSLENTEENLLKIAKDKIERVVKGSRKTMVELREERLTFLNNKEDE